MASGGINLANQKDNANVTYQSLSTEEKSSSLRRLRKLNFEIQGFSSVSVESDSRVMTRCLASSSSKNVNSATKMMEETGQFEWKCEHELCRRTILVLNVPLSMTEKKLMDFFHKFGKLRYARIIRDYKTKKSKGQAKLEYVDVNDAASLLNLPEQEFLHFNNYMKPTPTRCLKSKCSTGATNAKIVTSEENIFRPDFEDDLELTSDCYFNRLPDELLNYIFSFLDFRERISVEKVCKRWRFVNTKIAWVDMYKLSFRHKFNTLYCKPLTKIVLTSILERCGSTLREIDFSDCYHKLTPEFPIEISKYCPNLEEVNFKNTSIKAKPLKILSEVCKNLKVIKLQSCGGVVEKSVWWLLKTGENLRYLDITDNKKVTGKCFYLMKNSVDTLILNGCTRLSPIGFDHLKNCHGIRDLRLDNCRSLTAENLTTVIKSLEPSLTTLHLGGYFEHCDNNVFNEVFKHCHNLQSLHLEQNVSIIDDTILIISRNCLQLRHLNISGIMVTDVGLSCLKSLPHLRSLSINYNTAITDSAVIQLSEMRLLDSVEIRGCILIGDDGCVKLLHNCKNLKLLDISSCINVTNAIVDPAKLLRCSGESKLKIIAGGSSVTSFCDVDGLQILEFNLCPSQFRPFHEYHYDFDHDELELDYDDVDYDDDDYNYVNVDDFADFMYDGDMYEPL